MTPRSRKQPDVDLYCGDVLEVLKRFRWKPWAVGFYGRAAAPYLPVRLQRPEKASRFEFRMRTPRRKGVAADNKRTGGLRNNNMNKYRATVIANRMEQNSCRGKREYMSMLEANSEAIFVSKPETSWCGTT